MTANLPASTWNWPTLPAESLDYFAKHSPRAWRLLPENLAVVNVGVAFDHRADPAFVRRLSETLAGFRQDGTLLTILKKYDYVEPDDRSI